jgi:hypothetical protein
LQISPEALQNILKDIGTGTDGKNVKWTTDYKVELPITLNTSGPGSELPITVS